MAYDPNRLSDAAQEILRSMTDYHRERLHVMERELDAKRRLSEAGSPFSLARTVVRMASPDAAPAGPDRALLERCSALAGVHFDPQRVFLPWALLSRRDPTTTNAGSAGYLVCAESASGDAATGARPPFQARAKSDWREI
jgi:hypothetical protein